MNKMKTFYKVCKVLNGLNICPLLFGSLGLEFITKQNLNADDIDILIPKLFLKEKWKEFKNLLQSSLNMQLIDLHEHTFLYKNVNVAFASIDGLYDFAGVKESNISKYFHGKNYFKVLNLKQYLKVYNKSKEDGYRQEKKNNADCKKIEFITNLLNEQNKIISNFSFGLAEKKDLRQICNLYKNVIKKTLTTWDKNYPSKQIIINDIKNKELFTLKNLKNEIIGVVFVSDKFEDGDDCFTLKSKKPFRFARICVAPNMQGFGLGKILVEETIKYIKLNGGYSIKISVYKENISAIKTYENVGFVRTGEVNKYGYDFYLYELNLNNN